MILVPLFDVTFLEAFAAGGVGTSNRRPFAQKRTFPDTRVMSA